MSRTHLQEELTHSKSAVTAETQYGPVQGRRAANGAAVFLEVPYALPPKRFTDPEPLPSDFKYEAKEYILESKYAAQPTNDGQAAGLPYEDKVGLGKPSEDPLFVNVVAPPSFPAQNGFPVKVYIHGGFLQFGSPHGLGSQAQYISAERSEVWVNVGYRLSAFGFLASDEPKIDGNFGFKDQWLALLWIRDNIKAFGGDPDNIQVTGLSAGAHSVHQLLHHASRLPDGVRAPFNSAILQSNAIVTTPKTPAELRPQFIAFCRALSLDPSSPTILEDIRNPDKVPTSAITHTIETDALGIEYGTFRGAWEPSWLGSSDPMEWQRTGGLARGLAAHGVRSVVIGDLTEEWYLYSIAHPIKTMGDVERNLLRYYREDVVTKMLRAYLGEGKVPPGEMTQEELEKLFGEVLSEGQVHLPVRLFARDMVEAGFPVVRYEIRWTPEQVRPLGYVTHATDRVLWAFRLPSLQDDQPSVARAWLSTVADYVKRAEAGQGLPLKTVLALTESKEIREVVDEKWDEYMRMRTTLPGEVA
ncbi:carboxylesterase [Lentinus tigrinus ALCF2SS1-7]|uniref:Carboxylic ester hydrolase n=1 Tax=Lentinus tigrinus ALCF2SS1-6 TaxID=1328759 RepID=A0A5C2S8S7_9APHY|nr:carboxylesterase [Lentinus tigrinus ALCF2SS1-6]RPD69503.1 carboxylesterase [Lentinus tigrinus ALCF2SS1-7]